MYEIVIHSLRALNSFLTAGIAITAFSLLLYALSFNLRDRVARTFASILVCVVIVFVGEAFSTVAKMPEQLEFWQRVQWVGIIFLPAAYMHLSDALLSTTGRPSRGRRRLFVRLLYFVAIGFLLTLPTNLLVGPLVQNVEPAPHLQRTWLTWIFAGFYAVAMALSWMNFWRAYQRTVTSATRRRMTYLLVGALAPALGSYPYLLFGSEFAKHYPLVFWSHSHAQQFVRDFFADPDGLWRGILRSALARPGGQTPALQMDHARSGDGFHRPGDHHRDQDGWATCFPWTCPPSFRSSWLARSCFWSI